MANLTRTIDSKMPRGPKQEIPTKTPKSGRSRTKQAAWRREMEKKATDSRDGSSS